MSYRPSPLGVGTCLSSRAPAAAPARGSQVAIFCTNVSLALNTRRCSTFSINAHGFLSSLSMLSGRKSRNVCGNVNPSSHVYTPNVSCSAVSPAAPPFCTLLESEIKQSVIEYILLISIESHCRQLSLRISCINVRGRYIYRNACLGFTQSWH